MLYIKSFTEVRKKMSEVTCKNHGMTIPTYIPQKAHELPMFFENKPYQGASGRVYPIPYCDGISDNKTDVEYNVFTLENEYIKTVVAPELGGKILRGYDKTSDYDFIYYNEVVKPALVGLAARFLRAAERYGRKHEGIYQCGY